MSVPWKKRELLNPSHDLSAFKSSVDEEVCAEIDCWLKEKALSVHPRLCSTHVCLSEVGEVVAFFALKMVSVDLGEASNSVRRKYCDSSSNPVAVGILLAKLGLSLAWQGGGVGRSLLAEALTEIVDIAERSSFRLIVVDALTDDLVRFYEKAGFTPLRSKPRTLLMSVSKAREILKVNNR